MVMPHGMLDPASLQRKQFKKTIYGKLVEYPMLRASAGLICTHLEEERLARESVPGLALSPGAIAAALGLGAAVNIIIVFATWAGSSAANAYTEPFMEGVVCSRAETLFGVPALIVTLILVARALPLRPHVVGLLAGCGAGMIGDGINHLLCPISTLRHVLVWHSGVIVLLALLGWGAGLGWEFYEARRA